MSRTSESDVRAIISSDSTLDLSLFIQAASSLTDYVDNCDTAGLLSTRQLREIETWLSAWMYETRDQGYQEKKTGDASAIFQGRTGLYFEANFWGQRAVMIDITGCLAGLQEQAVGGKKSVNLVWLGKPESEQTDYVDRD